MSDPIYEEEALGKAYDARLIRRLWQYVRPYRGLMLLSFLLLLGVGAAQLVQPYLIKRAIDDSILGDRPEQLFGLAALFLAALTAEFALRFAQFYVLERTGQNVVFDLRHRVFELKQEQFDEAGADEVVTACASCRYNLLIGAEKTGWKTPVKSLTETVAANLAD